MVEKKEVLVIGGGIAGITAALELSQNGIPTTLIEKQSSLGGLSASFCCKASEACNKCFACVVDKRISDLRRRQEVRVLTETELVEWTGSPGHFRATLKTGKKKSELEAGAVVIAAGIDPYEATGKPEYGYGRFRNVITARDLDEMLRFRGTLARPSDGKLPETVAFFQCVGSRDDSIGNLYCSQVCCAYALRLIKAIRYQYPEVKATFLYMDIQPAGASFQSFLESCRKDEGIRLIRSLPSKVYHSPLTDTLRVRFTDSRKGQVTEETFDLIVLSVGMVLRKEAKAIGEIFGLAMTEDGFFSSPPPRSGLFLAGACSGPKDVDRSISHAKATAFTVRQFLQGRF